LLTELLAAVNVNEIFLRIVNGVAKEFQSAGVYVAIATDHGNFATVHCLL
jgi:uncharacterized protein YigA (DUF484 family)